MTLLTPLGCLHASSFMLPFQQERLANLRKRESPRNRQCLALDEEQRLGPANVRGRELSVVEEKAGSVPMMTTRKCDGAGEARTWKMLGTGFEAIRERTMTSTIRKERPGNIIDSTLPQRPGQSDADRAKDRNRFELLGYATSESIGRMRVRLLMTSDRGRAFLAARPRRGRRTPRLP
jgi:hypothetical protein